MDRKESNKKSSSWGHVIGNWFLCFIGALVASTIQYRLVGNGLSVLGDALVGAILCLIINRDDRAFIFDKLS